MNKTIIEKIRDSGLKIKYLAEQIGVSANYLSMCIAGKRKLSKTRQNKLNEILN